jgi:hypothetical protein
MTTARVEVCDPIEGDAIRAALRARGLVVVRRTPADVGRGSTPWDVLVLAAEVDGVRSILRALRALPEVGERPVLLLGAPAGEPGFDGAAAIDAGADGWLPRPVAVERLVRKVETLLAPSETQLRATVRERGADAARSTDGVSNPETGDETGSRRVDGGLARVSAGPRAWDNSSDSDGLARVRPDRTVRLDDEGGYTAAVEVVGGEPDAAAPQDLEDQRDRVGDGGVGGPPWTDRQRTGNDGKGSALATGVRETDPRAESVGSSSIVVADAAEPPRLDSGAASSPGARAQAGDDAFARRTDAGGAEGREVDPRRDARDERVPARGERPSEVVALRPATSDVAPTGTGRGSAAFISERLREALVAADRRVFPDAPPLPPSFPADEEGPEDLVPQELLDDAVAPVIASGEDDPLESFTHVLAMVPPGGTPMPMRTPGLVTPGSLAPGTAPRTPGPLTPHSARASAPAPMATEVPSAAGGGPLVEPRRHVAPSGAPVAMEPSAAGIRGAETLGLEAESTTSMARLRTAGSSRSRGSVAPPSPSRDSMQPASPDSVLRPIRPNGALGGAIEPAWGMLRVLARLCVRRLDGYLDTVVHAGSERGDSDASQPAGPVTGIPHRLVFHGGEVRRVESDVARRAALSLALEVRAEAPPTREREAEQWLARRARQNVAERLRVERHLSCARLDVLASIAAAERGSWTLLPLDAEDAVARAPRVRPFGTSTAAALVEVARRRFDAERARRALGGRVRLWAKAEADAIFGTMALPVELPALIAEDEVSFDAVVAATAPHEGYAGALLALAAFGALGVRRDDAAEAGRADHLPDVDDDRALVAAAAALAEDGDYFQILGVAPSASAREIHEAYERRRRALVRRERASLIGHHAFAPGPNDEADRREALRALDDALDVLSDASLRARYERALGLRPATVAPVDPTR